MSDGTRSRKGNDRRDNYIGYRHIFEKDMVDRSLEPSLIYSEARRRIALRVEIDKQRTLLGQGEPAARLTAVVVLPTPPF